jgi:hypothetical protein
MEPRNNEKIFGSISACCIFPVQKGIAKIIAIILGRTQSIFIKFYLQWRPLRRIQKPLAGIWAVFLAPVFVAVKIYES